MTFTYFVGQQQFDEVVGKDADATFNLSLPPAGVDNVLIQYSDDVSLNQCQLILIRCTVRVAYDRPCLSFKHTKQYVTSQQLSKGKTTKVALTCAMCER